MKKTFILFILLSNVMMLLMTGCGGVANDVLLRADEDATKAQAEDSNFKFCNIESDRICQSPRGKLIFHLPVDLNYNLRDLKINNDIIITNISDESVSIESYYIALTDNNGNFYRPEFSGPNDYNANSKQSPALIIKPGDKENIQFWTTLKPETNSIQNVSIFFRVTGEDEFIQVVVSYQPQNFFGL